MYTLMIIRHGIIKYYCADGEFRILWHNPEASAVLFKYKQDAIDAYDRWALKHPATSRGWMVRILEEE